MITKCPECHEWLVATASGAVCPAGHGGIYTGVSAAAIRKAQRQERRGAQRVAEKVNRLEGLTRLYRTRLTYHGENQATVYAAAGRTYVYDFDGKGTIFNVRGKRKCMREVDVAGELNRTEDV